MHSVLVLSYYDPWVAGGGHRPRRLMTEDLSRGRHVVFLHVEPAGHDDLRELCAHEPCAENLNIGQASGGPSLMFHKCSPRWVGKVSVDRFLEEFRPDVVRVHNPSGAHIAIAEKAQKAGAKILYDQMDLWEEFAAQPWGAKSEDWYIENADAISVVSSFLAARIPRNDVGVIPNGVTEAFINSCVAQRKGQASEPCYDIVYAGAMWPSWMDWKLIEDLVKKTQSYSWCFVGAVTPPANEDHGTHAQSIIDRLARMSNVTVLDEVEHSELVTILVNSRVGLVPFKCNALTLGASPIKVYDYLAAGLPVVSFNTPEVSDINFVTRCDTIDQYLTAIVDALATGGSNPIDSDNDIHDFTWAERLDKLDALVSKVSRNRSLS